MKKKTTFLLLIIFILIVSNLTAQNDSIPKSNSLEIEKDSLTSFVGIYPSIELDTIAKIDTSSIIDLNRIYNPQRDSKRLLYNTGLLAGAALVSFGLLWIAPESVSKWDKEEIKREGFFTKWKENVKKGPVVDQDDFVMNYIIHPWAGGVYYMAARGSGFKAWESATYSFLMSTFFWEYGIEAFAEIPSWQDLIITPVVGSVVGEGFFIAKKEIIKNDRRILKSKVLGNTTLFIMDPLNEFLDILGYKTKNKVEGYSSLMPLSSNPYSGEQTWGLQVVLKF